LLIESKINKFKEEVLNLTKEIKKIIDTFLNVCLGMPEEIKQIANYNKNLTNIDELKTKINNLEIELKNINNFSIEKIINFIQTPIVEENIENYFVEKAIVKTFYKEKYIEYLKLEFCQEVILRQKNLKASELLGFSVEGSESLAQFKKILHRLGFKDEINMLKVNGERAKLGIYRQKFQSEGREVNELSSGDRKTLALAFFIDTLYKNKNKLKLIIIDDPVDSNDYGKIAFFIDELNTLWNEILISKNGNLSLMPQFIHLTHNSEYLFGCVGTMKNNSNFEKQNIICLSKNEKYISHISTNRGFLKSTGEFLRSIVEDFLIKKDRDSFLRLVCIIRKYFEISTEISGVKLNCRYKKLLDYNVVERNQKIEQKSKNYSVNDFLKDYKSYGFFSKISDTDLELFKKNNFEIELKEIRNFYAELED